MRKVLLATTALVALTAAGAAHAATSPLTVNIGGSTDFVAGNFAESNENKGDNTLSSNHRDFETVYDLDFSVAGKLGNGIEYGGMLGLTNGADIVNNFKGTQTSPYMDMGYIWTSGAFGKVQMGDSHGATDLTVGTPTVGEGQVDGRYADFLDTTSYAKTLVYGVDGTDHSTNITYFTPKVGNENNKVQLGVSYVPQFYNYGSGVVDYNSGTGAPLGASNTLSPYKDVVKGALAYTGNIAPVALKASANVITGNSSNTTGAFGSSDAWIANAPVFKPVQSFTSWGIGAQAALNGFTLGGTYNNQGSYDAVIGQNKDQQTYGAGLKYEFSKYAVGVSYLGGEGYDNMLLGAGSTNTDKFNYVKDFNSYGAGGSYTWAPGLTSNLDGVYFNQATDVGVDNKGYVLLVSQKLAF
jgi:hypothetical protein